MLLDKVNTWLFYTFTQHVGAWNQCFVSANTSPKLKLLLILEQSQTWSNATDSRQHKCRPMLRLTKRTNEAIPCGPYLHHGAFCGIFVTESAQKWGVRLLGSRSGDSQWSENACKHTYEAFKIIISWKIKLLHFSLKITRMRSRRCFKRYNMFAEVFHLTIKDIHLILEVKTSFSNSTPMMSSSTESST
jgi:hypothetical protein